MTTADGTPHALYTRSEIGGEIQTVRLSTWTGAKWIQTTIIPTQALHNPRAVGASVGNLIEVAYVGSNGRLERCRVDPTQPGLCQPALDGPEASDEQAPSVAIRADGFGDFTFYRNNPVERGTWYSRFEQGGFQVESQVTGCAGGHGTVGLGPDDKPMVSCLDLNGSAVNVSFYDNLVLHRASAPDAR